MLFDIAGAMITYMLLDAFRKLPAIGIQSESTQEDWHDGDTTSCASKHIQQKTNTTI